MSRRAWTAVKICQYCVVAFNIKVALHLSLLSTSRLQVPKRLIKHKPKHLLRRKDVLVGIVGINGIAVLEVLMNLRRMTLCCVVHYAKSCARILSLLFDNCEL
jgi:hypothetical protein